MPRAPLSADVRAKLVEAVNVQGLSLRAAAAKHGVSPATVRNAVTEAKKAPAAAPSAPPPAPAPEAEEPAALPPGTTLDVMRTMLANLFRRAEQAERVGNTASAVTASKAAAELSNNIARLEQREREGGDAIVISRSELEQADREATGVFEAYLSRPLLCAKCSADLSAKWAGYESVAAVGRESHSGSLEKK